MLVGLLLQYYKSQDVDINSKSFYSDKKYMTIIVEYRHIKIKKPEVHFTIKIIFDKMDLRLFYFHVTI